MVTAGGLVFIAPASDNRFRAFDSKKPAGQLWPASSIGRVMPCR